MHRTTWLTIFACTFGLSLSASLPAGESGQLRNDAGKVMQAFCFSSHNDYREPAMYLSDIFEIQVPKTASVWYARDMGKVFEAYLVQKHGYVIPPPGNQTVFCSLHDSVAMAQGSKDLLIEQHRYYKQPVVEIGWKMSAQQAEAAATAAAAKTAAPAPAAALSPSMAYGYCQSSDYRIAFYSASFGSPIYKHPGSPWDPIKATALHWRQAWLDFLKKKYDFVGYTQCPSYASQAESQKDYDDMIRLARSAPPGQSVETGWTYVAATAAAVAPAVAAAPAAASRPATTTAARPATVDTPVPAPAATQAAAPAAVSNIHAVCWADSDQATRYYSAVFSGAGSDYADWMPAFKQFLQQKYNYQRTVRCNKQMSQAEALKYWNEMVAYARTSLLPGGGHPRIIETGWTYP